MLGFFHNLPYIGCFSYNELKKYTNFKGFEEILKIISEIEGNSMFLNIFLEKIFHDLILLIEKYFRLINFTFYIFSKNYARVVI